ncbi:NAD-dependent epimerase/dehydratase family protein [Streptomyces sp. NPDC054784]
MKTTALVTGGAGFIGSHTVDLLLATGHRVRILDSLQERVHPLGVPAWVHPEAEFRHGDVTDPDALADALDGMDLVFHLAAYQDHQADYHTFMHTNTESLARMFALAHEDRRRFPVRHVVYASSQAACGEGRYRCAAGHPFWPAPRSLAALGEGRWEHVCPDCGLAGVPVPMDIASCSNPTTAYGVSKLGKELLARALGPRLGIATTGMRYTHVLGTRNSVHNAYSGLARRSLLLLHGGRAPQLYEDGRQLCDVVDVRDVARANVTVVEGAAEGEARVFNVGGPPTTTVRDLAATICRAFGADVEPEVTGEFRFGDPRHMISDSAPLRATGWAPTVPLEETLADYVAWFATQPWSADALDRAQTAMARDGVVRSGTAPS